MHLQNQPTLQPLPAQGFIHPYHRQLDNIRRRPLHGRIHRGALAELAHNRLVALQLRQIPPTPHQRQRITVVLPVLGGTVHEALHARIFREIAVDELLRLLTAHARVFRKTKSADAVNQAEIDRFCAGTERRIHLIQRHVEDFAGSARVNVLPRAEGFHQCVVAGKVRHQAKLNLAVIRVQQYPARARTDFLALLRADGDVLQIRLAGRNAPGGGGDLVEGGVYAPGRVRQAQQTLDVSRIELRQLPIA